jgi:peptidoglycan/LPS O-acetylase OafA/YrhL
MATQQSISVPLPLTNLAAGRDRIDLRTATANKSNRIEFLDVLRGVAAFLVLCQHCVESVSAGFMQWTLKYVNLGEMGVVLFFIVSGFIIPVSIEKYNSLSRFWLGRVLRLWPTYLASLLIAVLLTNQHLPASSTFRDAYAVHPVRVILGNLTMVAEYIRIPLAIGAYWTLALELVFYMLCSALFLFGALRRTWTWLWASMGLLLVSQLAVAIGAHKSLPAGRIGLIVTALFGTLLYRQKSDGDLRKMILLVLPPLFAVFAVTFWVRFELYRPVTAGPYVLEHPSALCVIISWMTAYLLFLAVYVLRSWRFPRILIWIGQISYPLYLFHALVLAASPKTQPWPVFLLGTMLASFLLAYLTHILIEKPVAQFQHALLPHKPVSV